MGLKPTTSGLSVSDSCLLSSSYRTSRRNVRTKTWLSCSRWSTLTSSAGRRRRRNSLVSKKELWDFTQTKNLQYTSKPALVFLYCMHYFHGDFKDNSSPRYVEINPQKLKLELHFCKWQKALQHCVLILRFQEKRRHERAEQQRIRSEKDKERQARREVRFHNL